MALKIFKIKLWQQVVIGMILGILCGYIFKDKAEILKPIGTIYMSMLKMIIVPAVFFAILYGMTSISDIKVLGRIGIKAIFLYSFSIAIAVTIGILFANFFTPGMGTHIHLGEHLGVFDSALSPKQTITDIIVNIIPVNPVDALAKGNVLQIVVFAMFFAISIILVGDTAQNITKGIISLTNVVFKMVSLVIKATPYGVFAIMASLVGEFGFSLVISLGKLALVIIGAFGFQYLIFGLMILLAGLRPLPFYKKTSNVQTVAFATSTGKATIPIAISDLQEKMGVSKLIAGFILPLGAACNATGSAIYLSICAIFFAQITGVHFTSTQYIILIITSTIGSIGASGIPGGGVLMLGMVLSAVGLPLEGIPLIMGIDRIIDMFRTTVNVTGDCAITIILDKLEKTLNLDKYNKP